MMFMNNKQFPLDGLPRLSPMLTQVGILSYHGTFPIFLPHNATQNPNCS